MKHAHNLLGGFAPTTTLVDPTLPASERRPNMIQLLRLLAGIALCATSLVPTIRAAESAKPNIVYILADDLGYRDVHCLNPQRGKIATPQLDGMAAQGMIFTDAHSSSSVCTPTRYGIRSWIARSSSISATTPMS